MVDDENLHRAFLRFQFQPKLLLKRREDGRPGRVGRGSVVDALDRPAPLNIGPWLSSGVHCSVKSYLPLRPVLSRTVRPSCCDNRCTRFAMGTP